MHVLTDLYAVHPFWIWMALGAILLALEIVTASGYLLWPAGAAAIVALATPLHLGAPVEIGTFAGLTLVGTLVARRYWPHPLRPHGPDINDPHPRLVGTRGRAAGAFQAGHGRVFVDGKEWAAELESGGELASGAAVEITGVVSGACLKVKAA